MTIELKKFGTTLISRQAGREALAALRPNLAGLGAGEDITVDFDGVLTFSPSWGDEFLTPLLGEFGDRFALRYSRNPSVKATIETLHKSNEKKFRFV